jgi:putative glutathione S-transferase
MFKTIPLLAMAIAPAVTAFRPKKTVLRQSATQIMSVTKRNMVKAKSSLEETDADGRFVRTDATFRNTIEPGGRFEPEAGRYHLYISLACPWAAGTFAALKHKGLEDIIGHSIVHPTWGPTKPDVDEHSGWHFKNPGDEPVSNSLGHGSFDCDDALVPDTVNGAKTVRELYELADDKTGKYSTPILWCKKEKTIVCNESLEILKFFDSAFDEFAKYPEQKLFKEEEMEEAEALNEYIYPTVNNGVYRCGFAQSQKAYHEAHTELFASLERLEKHLEEKNKNGIPFLTGKDLTWIDLRLYKTLVRFDPVYAVYFKTSYKRIQDFPHLLKFVRKCYSIPAIKETTNLKHIKMHYFTSHPTLNTYGIIPESMGPPLE